MTFPTIRRPHALAALLVGLLASAALAGCGGETTIKIDPAEAEAGRKFKAGVFEDKNPKPKSRSGKSKKAQEPAPTYPYRLGPVRGGAIESVFVG